MGILRQLRQLTGGRMLNTRSLRARILLLTAIVVLPLVGLVSHMAHRDAERAFTDARARASVLVASAAAKHDEMLDVARNVLQVVAEAAEVRSDDAAACDAYVNRIVAGYSWMTGIVVADRAGRIVCSNRQADKAVNIAKWSVFRDTLATKVPAWTGYEVSNIPKKQLIGALQPIVGEAGNVERIIILGVDLTSFSRKLEDPAWDRDNATVTVVDHNGVVIGSYPAANAVIGLNASDDPAIRQILQQQSGVVEARDHKGVNRIAAFQPLKGTGATIIVAIARDPIRARINVQLQRDLAALVGLVLAALLVGVLASEVVLAPERLNVDRPGGSQRATSFNASVRARQMAPVARLLGALVAGLGLVVMVGWWLDLPAVTQILPGWPSMKIPTALGFMTSGAAVILATGDRDPRFRWAATLLSTIVTIGAAAILFEYAAHIDLGIDLHVGYDGASPTNAYPGRPTPGAALVMLAVGISLLLRGRRSRITKMVGIGIRGTSFFAILLVLIAYLYGPRIFEEAGPIRAVALHAALGMLVLIASLEMGVCGTGIARLFANEFSGSWIVRRLLPATIVMPIILGWAILQLQQNGAFRGSFGYAVVALATIITFSISLTAAARILDGLDFNLRSTMRKLELSNATLEQRVVERTAEVEAAAMAARASEARYRLLADNSTDMIVLHDRDGLRSYVSPASRRLLGYGPEEAVALSRRSLVHPDDLAVLQATMAQMSEDRPEFTSVHRLSRKDESYVWVEASIRRIPGVETGGGEFVASIRDVTERKQAEEALKTSEAQYRLLADNATDMIILTDAERRMQYVSPACRRVMGYEPDEYLSLSWNDLIHPDDLSQLLQVYRELTAEQPEGVGLCRARRKDGVYIWVEASAHLVDGSSKDGARHLTTLRDVSERKSAEEALKTSEAQYRLLADNTTDVTILTDPIGRRFYVSPACRRMFGYEHDEFVQIPAKDLVHPDDWDMLNDVYASLVPERRNAVVTYRNKVKGNGYKWVESSIHLAEGTPGIDGLYVATLRDISERKQAEEALKESEAQYRLLADNATDLIILYDGNRRSYVSPACTRILGYSKEEFAALSRADLVHPDDFDQASATFDGLTADQPHGMSTLQIRKKNGEYIWAESSLTLVDGISSKTGRIVATIRDVSARRRAEEEAENTFALLKDAIDVMDDAIAVYDADHRLVVKNQAMRSLIPQDLDSLATGRTFEAIAASLRAAADLDDEEDSQRYLAWRADKFARGDGVADEERLADGRWLLSRDFRLQDGGVICVATDITQLKQALAAEEAAREKSDAANHAKSAFLATMSHEIRTPLNGVLGFADLLLDSKLTVKQRRHLTLLRDAGKSLVTLINDILDISKIEAGRLELERIPVNPVALVDGAVAIIRSQALAKRLELRQDLAADLPSWIASDPTRLRQILLNLLSNAVKFTESGHITVAIRRQETPEGGRLHFEVADTGIGVPADRQHLLFQEFSQIDRSTTRKFGGTGLGLAICKKLAAAMGGEIGVESSPGLGSRFWFTIDLIEATAPRIAADDRPYTKAARPARILVAEDIYMNQLIVDAMLTAAGHEVVLVGNGAEVLEAVKTQDYDIVLMDIEMPILDGIEATKAIRSLDGRARHIPIIALTANAMPDVAAEYKAAGMNDYLSKPIDRERLVDLVGKWSSGEPGAAIPAASTREVLMVLDEGVLNDLENRLGKTKVTMFAEMLRHELDRAIGAITSSDDKEMIAGQAHVMVSLAGNLGCIELMTRSRELMVALRRNAPDALKLVAEIANAADRAGAALAERYPARMTESA